MKTEGIVTFEDIKRVLPHRYPFLLVDRVIQVGEERIQAIKNVTANEPFFNGHFPSLAVMPGVLQIEAMAQTAGLYLATQQSFDAKSEMAFLAGVDDAKFKRMVTPGDQLVLEATVLAKKRSILKVKASATIEGHLASSATIILMIKPL